MKWYGQPNGKRGRSQTFNDKAIQFCLSIKCVFISTKLGHEDEAKPVAPGWARLESAGLQHGKLAAKDAAGGYRRRATHDGLASAGGQHRHQNPGRKRMKDEETWCGYRRQWRKVHLGSMRPASAAQLDSCRRAHCQRQCDGADDTKDCHEAIALRAAHTIISTGKNAKPGRQTAAVAIRVTTSSARLKGREANIEEMERLPPAQPCRNQDALLQAAGRTSHGTRL